MVQHQPNPTHQRLGLAALVAAFAALIALGIRAERRIDLAEVARETPRPDDVLLASFPKSGSHLSLIHISEPTRRTPISYAVFCLKKKSPRD